MCVCVCRQCIVGVCKVCSVRVCKGVRERPWERDKDPPLKCPAAPWRTWRDLPSFFTSLLHPHLPHLFIFIHIFAINNNYWLCWVWVLEMLLDLMMWIIIFDNPSNIHLKILQKSRKSFKNRRKSLKTSLEFWKFPPNCMKILQKYRKSVKNPFKMLEISSKLPENPSKIPKSFKNPKLINVSWLNHLEMKNYTMWIIIKCWEFWDFCGFLMIELIKLR